MTLSDTVKDLFLIDQQLRGLESRLDGARTHVRAQQIKLEKYRAEQADLANQLRHTQAAEANLETDAAAADQRIAKLRDQMNAAANNKEYSALLVEVNTVKVDKGKVEEQALELMAQIEQLKSQAEEAAARVEEQKRILAHAEKELADRQAEVGERLEELRQQRSRAASNVPPSDLATFERIADMLDGEAMCPVVQDDPRRMEYTCGGCYISIPVETVNRLCTSPQKLHHCPSCRRILYLENEMKTAMGVK